MAMLTPTARSLRLATALGWAKCWIKMSYLYPEKVCQSLLLHDVFYLPSTHSKYILLFVLPRVRDRFEHQAICIKVIVVPERQRYIKKRAV
jgi:hypothetical protein